MKQCLSFLSLSFLLSITASELRAQSLKDALYSGRLKLDSGSTIKKTDDLGSKMSDSLLKTRVMDTVDYAAPGIPGVSDPTLVDTTTKVGALATETRTASSPDIVTVTGTAKAGVVNMGSKDNNVIWSNYMDSLVTTLQTELMANRKINKGTYSVLMEYEIDVDGAVTVQSVNVTPSSGTIEEEMKRRMSLTIPKLKPLESTTGKGRKALKRQTITLTKL